jgi:two-component system, sensor histidine kinase
MLLSLINNILDFSKIESGNIEIARKPVIVRELLAEVEQVISDTAIANGITLTVTCPNILPVVLGDPLRLKQILLNLTGNALKFCGNAKVHVTVETLPQKDEKLWLRFQVQDSGMGIPADKLESIFDKFAQVDQFETKRFSGTGLGLAICKRLVEAMGGSIGVTSELGKGSLFWFNVPFDRGSEVNARSIVESLTEKNSAALSAGILPLKGRILLVEDYPPNRQMAKKMLELLGCTVDVAQNGEEAIECVANNEYSIVFMDCQMPEMDGFQATAEIRKREKETHTVIVAMTAHVLIGDRERCLQAGMDDYISKPVRSRELTRILRHYLAA